MNNVWNTCIVFLKTYYYFNSIRGGNMLGIFFFLCPYSSATILSILVEGKIDYSSSTLKPHWSTITVSLTTIWSTFSLLINLIIWVNICANVFSRVLDSPESLWVVVFFCALLWGSGRHNSMFWFQMGSSVPGSLMALPLVLSFSVLRSGTRGGRRSLLPLKCPFGI